MMYNNWTEELGINAVKDVEAFCKESSEDVYFSYFIEMTKRLKNQKGLRTLLTRRIPDEHMQENWAQFLYSEVDTIFSLKASFDDFKSLVYYLVDDECLCLAEIDYDISYSFSGRKRTVQTDKLQILSTGSWNTFLSQFDFFSRYLTKEIANTKAIGVYKYFELLSVNKIRIHDFNSSTGVEDFTSFIRQVGDAAEIMNTQYETDLELAEQSEIPQIMLSPSYNERCDDIIDNYLNSVPIHTINVRQEG